MAGFHLDDTIAAVSTAMAPAGIGIVQVAETMHSKWRIAYSVQKKKEKSFLRSNPIRFIVDRLGRGGSD